MSDSNTKLHDTTDYVLFGFLLTLYLLFVITAFYHLKILWGMSYVYYLPNSFKIPLLAAGGAVFIPQVNRFLCNRFQDAMQAALPVLHQRTWLRFSLYVLGLLFLFVCFFHFFRVMSLYHDNTQAIFYMKRHLPIYEYYSEKSFIRNKPVLIFFFAFNKIILHDILGISPFYSLAVSSSLIGVLCVIVFIKLLRLFDLDKAGYAVLFSLLCTQSIHYYFFGYANYYTIVPFMIVLYLYAAARYIISGKSIIPALLMALLSILTHMGVAFILPSMVFLLVHRFRNNANRIYRLAVFSESKVTLALLISVVFGGYLLISLGIINLGPASGYLRSAFVQPFPGSDEAVSQVLFSIGHFGHFFNMLFLIAPTGILLFLLMLKNVKKVRYNAGYSFFLVWFSIGALAHILFIKPQYLYAWDIYAWVSAGPVLLGGFIYLGVYKNRKNGGYMKLVLISQSFMFFTAWIGLHNFEYAAAANYLESFPEKEYQNQVSSVIRTIHEQPMDHFRDARSLLIELEGHASTFQDYLFLCDCRYLLNHTEEYLPLWQKAYDKFHENERLNSNTADDYLKYLRVYSDADISDKNRRGEFEPLIKKMLRMKPGNPPYLVFYYDFLAKQEDYYNALHVMKQADSLNSSPSVSLLNKITPDIEIKMLLMKAYYDVGDYIGVINTYNELDRFLPADGTIDEKSGWLVLYSYFNLGNASKTEYLLEEKRFGNCNRNDSDVLDKSSFKNIGINRGIDCLRKSILSRDYKQLENRIRIIAMDNDIPVFKTIALTYELFTRDGSTESGKQSQEEALFTSLEYALNNQFRDYIYSIEEGLSASEKTGTVFKQLSAHIGNWIIAHTIDFINNSRQDSLRIYGESLSRNFPESYSGYLLTAVYLKNRQESGKAMVLFDRADELLQNNPDVYDKVEISEMIDVFRGN